jgi:hypothetical protein
MSMAKLICEEQVNGETVIRSWTTPNLTAAAILAKSHPGVGNPFWVWPSVPSGTIIGVDFTDAPIATNDQTTNLSLINAITATPEEKLTYA